MQTEEHGYQTPYDLIIAEANTLHNKFDFVRCFGPRASHDTMINYCDKSSGDVNGYLFCSVNLHKVCSVIRGLYLCRHLITESYFKDLHAVIDYRFMWLCEPLLSLNYNFMCYLKLYADSELVRQGVIGHL